MAPARTAAVYRSSILQATLQWVRQYCQALVRSWCGTHWCVKRAGRARLPCFCFRLRPPPSHVLCSTEHCWATGGGSRFAARPVRRMGAPQHAQPLQAGEHRSCNRQPSVANQWRHSKRHCHCPGGSDHLLHMYAFRKAQTQPWTRRGILVPAWERIAQWREAAGHGCGALGG